jgi:PiT family inorganic phosphate transporter
METAQAALWVVVLLVALALAFDFMNGFHDAANSIATVVSTGVLKPAQAVLFAAFFNFIAIFIFHLSVAATVGKGIVQPGVVDTHVVFGALVGAITWNVITWYYGIPSSSSHALIGGIVGAVMAKAGARCPGDRRHPEDGGLHLRVAGAGLPARLADDGAGGLGLPPRAAVKRGQVVPPPAAGVGRRLQPGPRRQRRAEDHRHHLDAADRHRLHRRGDKSPPTWVIVSCYMAIAPGHHVRRLAHRQDHGQKITKLKPVGGFCAETGGAMTLFMATGLGIPVSTTHTITGAIVGVGSTQRASAVRWGVAGNIVWAWILTIPASAFVAAIGVLGEPADLLIATSIAAALTWRCEILRASSIWYSK